MSFQYSKQRILYRNSIAPQPRHDIRTKNIYSNCFLTCGLCIYRHIGEKLPCSCKLQAYCPLRIDQLHLSIIEHELQSRRRYSMSCALILYVTFWFSCSVCFVLVETSFTWGEGIAIVVVVFVQCSLCYVMWWSVRRAHSAHSFCVRHKLFEVQVHKFVKSVDCVVKLSRSSVVALLVYAWAQTELFLVLKLISSILWVEAKDSGMRKPWQLNRIHIDSYCVSCIGRNMHDNEQCFKYAEQCAFLVEFCKLFC